MCDGEEQPGAWIRLEPWVVESFFDDSQVSVRQFASEQRGQASVAPGKRGRSRIASRSMASASDIFPSTSYTPPMEKWATADSGLPSRATRNCSNASSGRPSCCHAAAHFNPRSGLRGRREFENAAPARNCLVRLIPLLVKIGQFLPKTWVLGLHFDSHLVPGQGFRQVAVEARTSSRCGGRKSRGRAQGGSPSCTGPRLLRAPEERSESPALRLATPAEGPRQATSSNFRGASSSHWHCGWGGVSLPAADGRPRTIPWLAGGAGSRLPAGQVPGGPTPRSRGPQKKPSSHAMAFRNFSSAAPPVRRFREAPIRGYSTPRGRSGEASIL